MDLVKKIAFIQPANNYHVKEHQHALALTFPYLIHDLLTIGNFTFCLFVEGRSRCSFEEFLEIEKPNYIFITSNTSTFPSAVKYAKIAQKRKLHVFLGGIFATLNAEAIAKNYNCFNTIVKWNIAQNFYNSNEKIYDGKMGQCIDFKVSELLNLEIFDIYTNDPVCYEFTSGCIYNCSFCSLRKVWGNKVTSKRSICNINHDLMNLNKWDSLKLIDDDILQSIDILEQFSLNLKFKLIIAETRVDRINRKTIELLKRFGITHIILGVESFDNAYLKTSLKSKSHSWHKITFNAIELCLQAGIIPRPVLQFLFPGMKKNYIKNILPLIKNWKPINNIEVLFSFFTPHPGIIFKQLGGIQNLITNDLVNFNHLTPVYKPKGFETNDLLDFIEEYNFLITETNSSQFNPYICQLGENKKEYNGFFE